VNETSTVCLVRTINARSRKVEHLVSMWELSKDVKALLPASQYFHGEDHPLCANSPIELNGRSTACLELNVRSTVVNVRSKRVWNVVQQWELT
jgi:hypothetical protein